MRHPSVRGLPRELQHSGTEGCQIDWRDWLFLLAGLQVCIVQGREEALETLRLVNAGVPELPDKLQTLFESTDTVFRRKSQGCLIHQITRAQSQKDAFWKLV